MSVPVAPTAPRPSALRALFDPYPDLGPGATAALAAAAVLLGLAAARAGVRFDGPLDMHPTGGLAPIRAVPLGTALVDQAAALGAPALAGWAALRAASTRAPLGRAPLGRVAAVVGAARLPLVLAAPAALGLVHALPPEVFAVSAPDVLPPAVSPGVIGLALAAALAFAWYVALATAGLRAVGGVRGWRLAAVTAATLLGGELAAKLLLAALP